MTHIFARLTCAVVLVACAGLSAQEPAAVKESEYYPLKKDSTWTYRVSGTTVVLKVTGFEKINNEMCAKLDTLVNGKEQASEHLFVKDDGIYRAAINGQRPDAPIKIFALPPVKDSSWNVDTKIQNQVIKGKFVVKEEKGIKVPAGPFDCWAVEGNDFEVAGGRAKIKCWFAEKVGMVKLSFDLNGQEAVLELEKYEPGK